jgi:hypothetical protein
MIELEQAKALEKEAAKNAGHCTHCEQTIKIYRYGISTSMVNVLRAMGKASRMGGDILDVDKLDLRHSERTQLTKLRFHGLVAKVKKDGHQIPRHWVVTTKGWQFLGNKPVPAKVVVYNNQVLGHDGGETTVKRISGIPGDYEEQPITEAESRTLAHVRAPQYDKTVQAQYLGYSAGELVQGQAYELKMTRLQVGKPLQVQVPALNNREMEYKDIAAFGKAWKVIS